MWEKMLDEFVRKYGHEAKETITLARFIENGDYVLARKYYEEYK